MRPERTVRRWPSQPMACGLNYNTTQYNTNHRVNPEPQLYGVSLPCCGSSRLVHRDSRFRRACGQHSCQVVAASLTPIQGASSRYLRMFDHRHSRSACCQPAGPWLARTASGSTRRSCLLHHLGFCQTYAWRHPVPPSYGSRFSSSFVSRAVCRVPGPHLTLLTTSLLMSCLNPLDT